MHGASAGPVTDAALSFENVVKRFGTTTAVNGVSLEVRRGEMFGLIGPDGAGKTTTIRLACGLLAPTGGRVRLFGADPVREHGAITRSTGYLSQRFSLYGDLTVDENIAFFAQIHGLARYLDRADRLLEMTQLTPFRGRLADRLSGGMKQKLALACTLVHEPQVIFLDEPTTGVDPVSRREFWRLLSEFLAQGITIVMATPYLDEAERCSRVALLSEGTVLVADSPDALRERLPGLVVELIASPQARAMEVLSGLDGVIDVQSFGERIHARLAENGGSGMGGDARMRAVEATLRAAGIDVAGVRPVPASLEDVFITRVSQATQPSR
jgi:ABC-2 type transport system ATP-binding protein